VGEVGRGGIIWLVDEYEYEFDECDAFFRVVGTYSFLLDK